MERTASRFGRRRLLAGLGTAAVVGLAGCTGGGGGDGGDGDGGNGDSNSPTPSPQSGGVSVPDLDPVGQMIRGEPRERGEQYLSDTRNYEGEIMDAMGRDEIVVAVGAEGNGGNFAYHYPAIAVSSGTTVSWRWTGEGGQHNIVSDGPTEFDFSSGPPKIEGEPFEHTFEGAGIGLYVCEPHSSLGMKGAVVVIEG